MWLIEPVAFEQIIIAPQCTPLSFSPVMIVDAVFKSSVVLVCLERKQKRKGTHEIRVEAEDTKYREILPTVRCAVSNLPDSDGKV